MKIYQKNISFGEIDVTKINCSKRFLVGFETDEEETPILVFYNFNESYYPVNQLNKVSKIVSSYRFVKGFCCSSLSDAIDVISNLKGRAGFNNVEKLLLLKLLTTEHCKIKDSLSYEQYQKYLPLLELSNTALELIAMNKISVSMGFDICELNSDDTTYFVNLIKSLNLNHNEQKELLASLKDLSIRTNAHFKSILESEDLKSKTELLNFIKNGSQPRFYRKKKEFEALKKRLSLPAKTNLVETPYFESKNLKIELFFKNYAELKQRISQIEKSIDTDKTCWEGIFSIL